MVKNNRDYKNDIDSLFTQLTALLKEKVNFELRASLFGIVRRMVVNFQVIISQIDQISVSLSQPTRFNENLGDENTDPAAQPLFWVSKWVDYTDKYGFGYQLCDEGMGVMFNDTTKLIMLTNGM